jgi:hypothetical protein
MAATQYWRISPGQGGFLWREQKLNECIALGWSDIGNAKRISKDKLQAKFRERRWSTQASNQLYTFVHEVQIDDKIVASASGKGVYAVGTVVGDYEFNPELEYKHSRKVRWETTFWHPVGIGELRLPPTLHNKFHGRSSKTIRNLTDPEWKCFCKKLNRISTPFRNLGMWGGLIQSPEYENEVIILFSQMLQHLHMRVAGFGTRFPDAIIERKESGKWKKVNVEFELCSQGFQCHLDACKEKDCRTLICWEDNWEDSSKRQGFEIIELKSELKKLL